MLKSKLEATASKIAEQAPAEVLAAMQQTIGELMKQSDLARKAGDKGVDFKLKTSNGSEIELKQLLKKGPVVLKFNRGSWCPFCQLELKEWAEKQKQLNELGAELLVLSPQLPGLTSEFSEQNKLGLSFAFDEANRVASSYGLTWQMPAELKPVHLGFNMDVPANNGDDSWTLPFPAVYLIDTTGVIRYSYVPGNWMERAEPDDVIAAVKNLKQVV